MYVSGTHIISLTIWVLLSCVRARSNPSSDTASVRQVHLCTRYSVYRIQCVAVLLFMYLKVNARLRTVCQNQLKISSSETLTDKGLEIYNKRIVPDYVTVSDCTLPVVFL